jgi:hypothetical protein
MLATTGLDTDSGLAGVRVLASAVAHECGSEPALLRCVKELCLRFDAQGDHNGYTGSGGLYTRGDDAG